MKVKLAKYSDKETVQSLRNKQVDIMTKWVATQNKPPVELADLEKQKEDKIKEGK